VHLTLVGERPLSDPASLGDLVTPSGRFVDRHTALVARSLARRLDRRALLRELEAQIDRVERTGIRPSHLDGHQHVHLLPGIWPIAVELARRHGIRWVRLPAFRPLMNGAGPIQVGLRWGLNVLQRRRKAMLRGLRSAHVTPALAESGHLDAERIMRALERVPAGAVAELVTHPGSSTGALEARYDWGYDWSGETAALTDHRLRSAIDTAGFELRRFSDLAA
jgi:predicted glycoside hydrolase/deacetylase ChbG (UPF0249 family)